MNASFQKKYHHPIAKKGFQVKTLSISIRHICSKFLAYKITQNMIKLKNVQKILLFTS